MSKASVTYIGTPDDDTSSIEQFGQTFEKGKAVQMDADDPNLDKLRNNPTFKVTGGKAD